MQTRLGLSITPTSLGWVLVDGPDADDQAIDYDVFDVQIGAGATAASTAHLAAATRRAHAIATASGHEVHSIGVTWSQSIDADANRLRESLSDLGDDAVVMVGFSQATRALARGIGRGIGYEKAGVCVVEPAAVSVVVADTEAGAARTFVNSGDVSAAGLSRWLTELFEKSGWRPEGLFLVGAHTDVDAFKPHLDDLAIEVFPSGEPQLALALGAALASTENSDTGPERTGHGVATNVVSWLMSQSRRLTIVAAGVSALLAMVLLMPIRGAGPVADHPAANTSVIPARVPPGPAPGSAPEAPPVIAPASAAPTVEEPRIVPVVSEPVEAVVQEPIVSAPLATPPTPQEPISPPPVAPAAPPVAPAPEPSPPDPVSVILGPLFSALP